MDLKDQKFGKLTAKEMTQKPRNNERVWRCECECGKECLVRPSDLVNNARVSCGCAEKRATHGQVHKAENNVWRQMRQRCLNPNKDTYKHYGGRGITICPEWDSFEQFLKDMGPRPGPYHKLDRLDNNGNYCKENCAWRSQKEQIHNQRHSIRIPYGGKNYSAAEWSRRTGIPVETIRDRYHRGLIPEQILEPTPVSIQFQNEKRGIDPIPPHKNTEIYKDRYIIPSRRTAMITIGGVTKHLEEWAAEMGISDQTIRRRIRLGKPESEWLKPTLWSERKNEG